MTAAEVADMEPAAWPEDGRPADDPELADMLDVGWHIVECPHCGDRLELTAINPAYTEIALALHRLGHCAPERTRYSPTDDLPALPADVTAVRLLDHHGNLIEEMPAAVYERMRGPANASRRVLRDALGTIDTTEESG